MININLKDETYICPFCGKEQAFRYSNDKFYIGYHLKYAVRDPSTDREIFVLKCNNQNCQKVSITSFCDDKQFDIEPEFTCKKYPTYIPEQIRNDYEEAVSIIDKSPKASATLFRRCLQGMIHDYWDIKEKNLNAEITSLKDKVPTSQWNAIDGLRNLGNIGAHMEKDINLIIDIDPQEAVKLQKLVELLIEKWYIARHDEQEIYKAIVDCSNEKEGQRKVNETRD